MKRLAVIAALLLSVTSCGNELVSEWGGSMNEQETELMQRPSIEEIHQRYSEMDAKLKAELGTAFPWMQWMQVQGVNRASCADFDAYKDDAEGWTLDIWGTEGNIPDNEWPRAEQIFAKVTGEYGFTPPRVLADRPAQHDVTTSDQYGATYNFGSGKRTSFSGSTGCHLPQAAKDKLQNPS